jgi:YbbR domain-containing protein
MRYYHPFGHFGLKLISVAIALLLWMTVSGQQIVERGLRVPLEIHSLPEKLELVDQPPEFVDVRVRGGSAALSRLAQGDIVAIIDVKSARAGRRVFNLSGEQVRTPFGIEVSQVSPSTVTLGFDPAETKRVPVVPTVDGEPAPGFVRGKTSVDPPAVDVVGPSSAIARVTEALTEPVGIDDARADRVESVTIGLADSTVRLKTPSAARVSVQILPAPVEHLIERTPVHIRGLGTSLSAQAEPSVIGVRARGAKGSVERLAADAVTAYVDVTGLGPGVYTLPVHVDPTRGFGVAAILPGEVTITIH